MGLLKPFVAAHTTLHEWGGLSNATDMFYPEYTERLKSYLRMKTDNEEQVNAWFIPLTTPEKESVENRQRKAFLEIAKEIGKEAYVKNLFSKDIEHIRIGLPPQYKRRLEQYWEKYRVLGGMFFGMPYPFEHYLKEFTEFFKSGKDAERTFAEIGKVIEEHRSKKRQLEKQLELSDHQKEMFAVYAEFMLTKLYRRYSQLTALSHVDALLQEIADRLNISNHEARCMLFEEMEVALTEGTIDRGFLRERTQFCTLYAYQGFCQVLVGDAARTLAERADEKIEANARELKGQCASLGKTVGTVKIIITPSDMMKMKPGDILVAIATNPDVVPAMKKAAAIVSRELGIPCVIGTKIATKVLKDGDRVEVDAGNGIVRILKNNQE